ncbi:hypothetical protein FGADI_4101 [Fusarium gaditjirri]|uniref:Cytochrome P450 n=1 Tax=Fusarium gaditjirri TaxID=282569 RepID=A0A8H4TDT0_9HYPO|nr:hypothetical protein FGADI_4101 [Fusarium gaditjirri]
MAGQAMDGVTATGVPGTFLVDILPLLRYVPDWVPGENFERLAKKWSSELDDLTERPYAFVKHQHASSMALYPDVQQKVQEDTDRVIGNERPLNYLDHLTLPYVDATVKEVLGWLPVVPMRLPRTSNVYDVFEGYFVPRDALIMPNIWYFAHDPEVHHEPMRFNPERFLSTDGYQPEQDPQTYTFGFGRRSLAVLHIRKDENGAQPELLFTPGMIIHPEPFKAAITPRLPH